MNNIKMAVALWQPQINDIRKYNSNIDSIFLERERKSCMATCENADEKYVVYYWDWEYIDPEHYDELKKLVRRIRHALIEVSEDGNIFSSIETDDDEGCDGCFEDILSWRVEIGFNGTALI